MLGEVLLRVGLLLFAILGLGLTYLAASEQASVRYRNGRFWRLWGAGVASFLGCLFLMVVITVRIS